MFSAGEIPLTWLKLNLGDVVNYGLAQKVEPFEINDDVWVLELEDIEKNSSKILQKIKFSQRKSKSTKNKFEAGDVLYGKLRPYLNKVAFADEAGVCTTEIVPIKGNQAINSKYLFYWLKHPIFLNYVTEVSHGVNMPRLGTDAGRQAPIVLAPYQEQRRIAHKLDTTLARVDALNDRLARITPLLQRFRQSVLAAATSGRLTEDWRTKNGIPCEWKYSKISDRCTLKSGKSYSVEYEQELGDFLYLKVSDMNIEGNSFVIEKSSRYIASSVLNERELIPVRSVIFPKRGGAIATNKKSLVLHKPIVCDLNIMSINIPQDINEFFFYYWFKTIDLASLNNGSTIPQVNNVDINPLVFPEPRFEEQTEIVRRVETLFAFADRLQARLQSAQTAAERLTPALLAKAFRGELVPQDPNDEPATELLRRLSEARAAEAPAKSKRGRKTTA